MAAPTLSYSESTGSDTAASGKGPSTAVTAANAAHTNGSNLTTVTLTDGPDLSGVAVDDVLYVGTPAGGRHLSQITEVWAGDTLTCTAGASGSIYSASETISASAAGEVWRLSIYVEKAATDTTEIRVRPVLRTTGVNIEGMSSFVNLNTGVIRSVSTVAGGAYSASDMTVTSVDADWWHIEARLTDAAGAANQGQCNLYAYELLAGTVADRSIGIWNATLYGANGTNILPDSNEFSAWGIASATVTSDTSEPPPIRMDGDTLHGAAGANSYIRSDLATISSSAAKVWSVTTYVAKEASAVTEVRMRPNLLFGGGTEEYEANIDTNTGVVRSVSSLVGGPYTTADVTVTSFDANFWKVVCAITDNAGTATAARVYLYSRETGGGTTGGRAVYLHRTTVADSGGVNVLPYPDDLTGSTWSLFTSATVTPNTTLAPLASEREIEVADGFTIAVGDAVTYGIGGKRKTLTGDATWNDIDDGGAGWIYQLDAGTYPCANNGTHVFQRFAAPLADGPITVKSADDAWSVFVKPDLTWTGAYRLFYPSSEFLHLEGLSLTSVEASSSSQPVRAVSASYLKAIRCDFSSAGSVVVSGTSRAVFIECDFTAFISSGFLGSSGSSSTLINCTFHDCSGSGAQVDYTAGAGVFTLIGCRSYSNDDHGYRVEVDNAYRNSVTISNCVSHGNGDSGLFIWGTPDTAQGPISVTNCIFANNGDEGITAASDVDLLVYNDFNAFYLNSGGEVDNITKGPNSVTLSADPFVDAASGDFRLNTTPGGGADLRGTGLGYTGP